MTEGRQLLLVASEAELYGIDLEFVLEIRAHQPLTRLPHAPEHVIGITNVGGRILPVIDLCCRLWGRKAEPGALHAIVVVRQDDRQCGILVDAANEIMEFTPGQIEEMPARAVQGCFNALAVRPAQDGVAPVIAVAILDLKAIASFSLNTMQHDGAREEINHA